MAKLLVVRTKVNDYIKKMGVDNVAGNVAEALSKKVEQILAEAVERAKANKRKTVMKQDI